MTRLPSASDRVHRFDHAVVGLAGQGLGVAFGRDQPVHVFVRGRRAEQIGQQVRNQSRMWQSGSAPDRWAAAQSASPMRAPGLEHFVQRPRPAALGQKPDQRLGRGNLGTLRRINLPAQQRVEHVERDQFDRRGPATDRPDQFFRRSASHDSISGERIGPVGRGGRVACRFSKRSYRSRWARRNTSRWSARRRTGGRPPPRPHARRRGRAPPQPFHEPRDVAGHGEPTAEIVLDQVRHAAGPETDRRRAAGHRLHDAARQIVGERRAQGHVAGRHVSGQQIPVGHVARRIGRHALAKPRDRGVRVADEDETDGPAATCDGRDAVLDPFPLIAQIAGGEERQEERPQAGRVPGGAWAGAAGETRPGPPSSG